MVEVSTAIDLILASIKEMDPEVIDIREACGRVASGPVASSETLPRCRTSAMDGYAVLAASTPGDFKQVSAARAGDLAESIEAGTCAWVTTGGPVPDGADSVCPVEFTASAGEALIRVPKCTSGKFIRRIGSDLEKGQILVEDRETLGPAEVALLISAGITRISVLKQPLVGILSTGSELLDFGSDLQRPSQVRDSNRPLLHSLLLESHARIQDYGIAPDTRSLISSTLQTMSSACDLIITSGGVSMGDRDEVKPSIEELGQVLFGRVNMKPGKPTTYGKLGNTPIFALPGNPASCFVTYYLFVTVALRKMQHQSSFPLIPVSLTGEIKLDMERPEYHRASVAWHNGKFMAVSTGDQSSSRIISAKKANCLLLLPKGEINGRVTVTEVEGMLIRGLDPWQEGMKEAALPSSCHAHKEHFKSSPSNRTIAVLTVSDRAATGVYSDASGPVIRELLLQKYPSAHMTSLLVPDSIPDIQSAIQQWANEGTDLILTTGGTGLSPRDLTPEAVSPLLNKVCPGFVVQMLTTSLQITPMAMLSRPVAGIIGHSLVITLPGSVKGAKENLQSLFPALDHALSQLRPSA